MADFDAVPMEYRAQIENRCKRQYPKTGDATRWVDEWITGSRSTAPFRPVAGKNLRILIVRIDWRLLTNSGTDEGVIRPVIGAGGWPLIPGSSIKGLFRQACRRLHPDQLARWCGNPPDRAKESDGTQGSLRFHGAIPTDQRWQDRLLDIVHGQQRWQLWDPDWDQQRNRWNNRIRHNANAIISLYQPELCIAISTSDAHMSSQDWDLIQETLDAALAQGIGGRTCAGYGSVAEGSGNVPFHDVIFECGLEGQGIASTLLSRDAGEFRPNIFRAAIRGMALRLFGGLCSTNDARRQTGRLFGSIDRLDGGLQRGLLDCHFRNPEVELATWGDGQMLSHVFAATGILQWKLTTNALDQPTTNLLKKLLSSLHALTYCLGGFGRGWRRPDHFIFYPDYYALGTLKPAIGCHWQLRDASILTRHPEWAVASSDMLGKLLRSARENGIRWLTNQGVACQEQPAQSKASWREIIDPEFMQIWMRDAQSISDAEAIHWFHKVPTPNQDGRSNPHGLKHSSIAGYVRQSTNDPRATEVSRIWNRMLPCVTADSLQEWLADPDTGLSVKDKSIVPWSGPYWDIVVLFADRHAMDADPAHQRALIASMDAHDSPFDRVHF